MVLFLSRVIHSCFGNKLSTRSIKILFSEIAPVFADREGGYTRIIKLGRRRSDGSEMAILEFVEETTVAPVADAE